MSAVHRRIGAAFVIGALAIGTVMSRRIGAYAVQGYTWASQPVSYYLNPANMDLPDATAVENAVFAGADTWRAQSHANFRFQYAGRSTQATNTMDNVNLVMFRNASNGSAIATTYSWFIGSRIVDADIVFWDGGFLFFTGTSGCSGGFYIEDIAAHEFGHALGLSHSTVTGATMYPTVVTCDATPRVLDPDDIAGVESLYPPVNLGPAPPSGFRILVSN
jgi:hypothetical protein